MASKTKSCMITDSELLQLQRLIDTGKEKCFYWWSKWGRVRAAVLKLDHNECQLCKARGRYAKATIVHHVRHLKDRPDLALSIWDPDTGERQLISVCKQCHGYEHPESLRPVLAINRPLTEECWD